MAAQPIACTLSPGEMGVRLADLRELFAEQLVAIDRDPLALRLTLAADGEREAAARDLFAREQQCCGFFSMRFERRGAVLAIALAVPPEAGPILDEFEQLAVESLVQAPR